MIHHTAHYWEPSEKWHATYLFLEIAPNCLGPWGSRNGQSQSASDCSNIFYFGPKFISTFAALKDIGNKSLKYDYGCTGGLRVEGSTYDYWLRVLDNSNCISYIANQNVSPLASPTPDFAFSFPFSNFRAAVIAHRVYKHCPSCEINGVIFGDILIE